MEMRGTGRSWAAAPKFSPALASVSLVGSFDIALPTSLAAAATANLGNRARLLGCLGGHGGFALAVFLKHGKPALRVVGVERLGRQEVARMCYSGGKIGLGREAEVRRCLVRRCRREIDRPIATSLGMCLVADVAEPYVVAGIEIVRISDHDPVPWDSQSHQPIGNGARRVRITGAGDCEGTTAIVQVIACETFQICAARLIKPAARRVEWKTHHFHVRLDGDRKPLLHRHGIFRPADGIGAGAECQRRESSATTQERVRMGHGISLTARCSRWRFWAYPAWP